MPHIKKLGPKRYKVRYRAPDGRERSKTFSRRSDAQRFMATVEHSKATGTFVDPRLARQRLEGWAARWISTAGPTLKAKTVASYESLINSRIVPALGQRALDRLRPSDVQEWVNAMQAGGLSASRIRQAHVTLKQILDGAMRDGAVGRNAALGVKLPKLERREQNYFEPGIVEMIADAIADEYRLLIGVLGILGLRWGEAAAIRRRHIDLMRQRVIVEESLAEIRGSLVPGRTKSHAERKVPLTPALIRALTAHLDECVGPDAVPTSLPRPKVPHSVPRLSSTRVASDA